MISDVESVQWSFRDCCNELITCSEKGKSVWKLAAEEIKDEDVRILKVVPIFLIRAPPPRK
jgi:hypothetical protein